MTGHQEGQTIGVLQSGIVCIEPRKDPMSLQSSFPEPALPSQRRKSRSNSITPRWMQFPLLPRVTVDCNRPSGLMRRDDLDELRESLQGMPRMRGRERAALPDVGKVRCCIQVV